MNEPDHFGRLVAQATADLEDAATLAGDLQNSTLSIDTRRQLAAKAHRLALKGARALRIARHWGRQDEF